MSQIVYEFYYEFICNMFSKKLPLVLSLTSVLEMDGQKMSWLHKKLIAKIDRLKMNEMGFIPFNYSADIEAISKLSQYINEEEKVCFAMLSLFVLIGKKIYSK